VTGAELRRLAPRLCAAYDGLVDEFKLASHQHRIAGDELLSADRCLAHRELQLVRAGRTGRGAYALERHRKLDEIHDRRNLAERNHRGTRARLDRAVLALFRVERPFSSGKVRA
jgi:hypothetical protein